MFTRSLFSAGLSFGTVYFAKFLFTIIATSYTFVTIHLTGCTSDFIVASAIWVFVIERPKVKESIAMATWLITPKLMKMFIRYKFNIWYVITVVSVLTGPVNSAYMSCHVMSAYRSCLSSCFVKSSTMRNIPVSIAIDGILGRHTIFFLLHNSSYQLIQNIYTAC